MKRCIQFGGALAALTLSLSAHAYIIDLFSEGNQTLADGTNANGGHSSQVGPFPNTIVGSYRDARVEALSGASDVDDSCGTDQDCSVLNIGGGTLDFSNDTPGVVGVAEVQWDGDDSAGDIDDLDYTGLGGVDFVIQEGCPAGGCDHFTFSVIFIDQAFDFLVGVYTDSTHWTEFDLHADTTLGDHHLYFADFASPVACNTNNPAPGVNSKTCGAGGTADFTNVGAMRLVLNTGGSGGYTSAIDLTISGITKEAPEPATLALLGAGFAAAGGLSRRRRRKERAA